MTLIATHGDYVQEVSVLQGKRICGGVKDKDGYESMLRFEHFTFAVSTASLAYSSGIY